MLPAIAAVASLIGRVVVSSVVGNIISNWVNKWLFPKKAPEAVIRKEAAEMQKPNTDTWDNTVDKL